MKGSIHENLVFKKVPCLLCIDELLLGFEVVRKTIGDIFFGVF